MKYKKNQEENFIFECVREKLFLCQFTVRTLYFQIINVQKIDKFCFDYEVSINELRVG